MKFLGLIGIQVILRSIGIGNKSVTGARASDHRLFALRVATQFGLESNPASGAAPTRPLRPYPPYPQIWCWRGSGVTDDAANSVCMKSDFPRGQGPTSGCPTIRPE